MSYTTIIHVFPGEKVECGEELKNSWGSAPYVWDFMIKKYIDPDANMMYGKAADQLWKLWERTDIPVHQRAVLMMTFDRAYVSKEHFERAAEDIRLFLKDHMDSSVINHWPHIMEIFKGNPDVPAIGFWHTSVSDLPFKGKWNEDEKDYDPIDWNQTYEIYTELATLE